MRNGERKRKAKERHLGNETTAFLVATQCILVLSLVTTTKCWPFLGLSSLLSSFPPEDEHRRGGVRRTRISHSPDGRLLFFFFFVRN